MKHRTPTPKHPTHSPILPTLITLAITLPSTLPLQAAPLKSTDEVTFTCPPETARQIRHIERTRIDRELGLPGTTKELSCTDKNGKRTGPALRLRQAYRFSTRALKHRSRFSHKHLITVGHYKAGRRHGRWSQFGRNGEVLGENALHLGTGSWKIWYDSGRLAARGQLVADKRVGEWAFWSKSGHRAAIGHYQGGERHGEWRRWSARGELRELTHFNNGKLHGLRTTWWPTGDKHEEGRYEHGSRDGRWSFWASDGRMLGINELRERSGRWVLWYPNGFKREEGDLRGGRRSGHWLLWNTRGQKRAEGDYRRGATVPSTWIYYDTKGRQSNKKPRDVSILSQLSSKIAKKWPKPTIQGLHGQGLRGGIGGLGIAGRRARKGTRGSLSITRGGGVFLGGVLRGHRSRFSSSRLTVQGGAGGKRISITLQFDLPKGVSISPKTTNEVHQRIAGCLQSWRARTKKAATPSSAKQNRLHTATFNLLLRPPLQITGAQQVKPARAFDPRWHRCVTAALQTMTLQGQISSTTQAEAKVRAW